MDYISYISTMEEWKDINGFEGLYQVSNFGNVKSLARYVNHWQGGLRFRKEKILKPFIKQGYHYVDFGRKKQYRVHRLVAQTFLDNPYDKPDVNHIDGNKLNNEVNNLEWVTASENMIHLVKNKLWNNQYTINKVGQKKNCVI